MGFQALDGNDRLLLPMLGAALERCKQEGVQALESSGSAFEKSGLHALAPYRQTAPWLRFYYKTRSPKLAQRLANPDVWAPSPYESTETIT